MAYNESLAYLLRFLNDRKAALIRPLKLSEQAKRDLSDPIKQASQNMATVVNNVINQERG